MLLKLIEYCDLEAIYSYPWNILSSSSKPLKEIFIFPAMHKNLDKSKLIIVQIRYLEKFSKRYVR